MTTERKAAANSTFAIGVVSYSADSLAIKESSVLRISICDEKFAYRKSTNRFAQKPRREKPACKSPGIQHEIQFLRIFQSQQRNLLTRSCPLYSKITNKNHDRNIQTKYSS